MHTFRRRAGWGLVGLSLALHVFSVYCFSVQPDRFAAFTVLPIWLWGGLGLVLTIAAYYFLRAPLSLVMTGVWAVTLFVGADEARGLANLGHESPAIGRSKPWQGNETIRVITLNCATGRFGDVSSDLAAWQPDIVLLQEVFPHQLRTIADALYQGRGDYRFSETNGIITRWKILREVRVPNRRSQQVTIEMPGGNPLEVVNLHLSSAATNLRFWDRATWREHRVNRALRIEELVTTREILEQTTSLTGTPVLLGGDFNAPATDVIHRHLPADLEDAFARAGTGWGNTFQRRFPILRIDVLRSSPFLEAVRSMAHPTRKSDHRMVIADFVLR